MSGHSRWAQIKRKKAVTDQKRSQSFARLSRLITIAARKGSDVKVNIPLAHAIENARSQNMPQENIERAIQRGSESSAESSEEFTIDAVGPGGVGLSITVITDSRNRTISEVRKILSDHNARLVPPGSIAWMFGQPPRTPVNNLAASEIDSLVSELENHADVERIQKNIQ